MSILIPLHLGSVHIYPHVSLTNQLTKVQVVTEGNGCELISGYDLDSVRYPDFSDQFVTPELIVKIKKDATYTVLKTIMIFSKHRAPFTVTLERKAYPPVDTAINQKYLEVLKQPLDCVPKLYQLLNDNPSDFPMIPVDRMMDPVLRNLRGSHSDVLDLRSRVTDLMNPYSPV